MHARSLFAAALVAAVLIPGVVSGHLNGGKWNWNFVIGCAHFVFCLLVLVRFFNG